MLSQDTISALAQRLERARTTRTGSEKITLDHPELTVDDAYVIQDALREIQHAELGVAGLKMGFTSRAKMAQMKVKDPINGYLTQKGRIAPGGSFAKSDYIFPRIEAEIAVITKAELTGPGCTIAQVQAAIGEVLPALEVIDSRFVNYGFDLPSVVADNTSAAAYMVGEKGVPVDGLDLKTMGVVTLRNGEVVATAAGAAVLGSPLNSVALLANMLGRRGKSIPAGTLILTGGITEAVPAEAGDHFTIKFQHLGQIDLQVRA